MNNNLTDLNDYLFETLEKLTNEDLNEEQLQKEIIRSNAVTSVAGTIIENAELSLRVMKHLNEYGIETAKNSLPPMLEAKGRSNDKVL